MLILKAFKDRLNTSIEADRLMSQYAGNCRFFQNKDLGLNMRKEQLLCYRELDWWSKLWKQSEEYVFFSLQDLTKIFLNVSKRTIQRDLSYLQKIHLLEAKGKTTNRKYHLKSI